MLSCTYEVNRQTLNNSSLHNTLRFVSVRLTSKYLQFASPERCFRGKQYVAELVDLQRDQSTGGSPKLVSPSEMPIMRDLTKGALELGPPRTDLDRPPVRGDDGDDIEDDGHNADAERHEDGRVLVHHAAELGNCHWREVVVKRPVSSRMRQALRTSYETGHPTLLSVVSVNMSNFCAISSTHFQERPLSHGWHFLSRFFANLDRNSICTIEIVIELCAKDSYSPFESRLRSNLDSNSKYSSFVQRSITLSSRTDRFDSVATKLNFNMTTELGLPSQVRTYTGHCCDATQDAVAAKMDFSPALDNSTTA